jgi:hypothetical protein
MLATAAGIRDARLNPVRVVLSVRLLRLANSHRDPAFPRFQGREAELLVDAVAVGAGLQTTPIALPDLGHRGQLDR